MRHLTACSTRVLLVLCAFLFILTVPLSSFGAQAKGELKADTAKAEALIDINSANVDDLSNLPGIGPKIAGEIIAYRTGNGPFKSVQDLENVKGIGAKKLAKLKDLVTVTGAE